MIDFLEQPDFTSNPSNIQVPVLPNEKGKNENIKNSKNRIHLSWIPDHVLRTRIIDKFSTYGRIKKVDKGIGEVFIEYFDDESAEKAIKEMNGNLFDTYRICVQPASTKPSDNYLCSLCKNNGHL